MEKPSERTIESTANYEGNATILLFERVKNPVIWAQIIDLLEKGDASWVGQELFVVETDKEGRMVKNEKGEVYTSRINRVAHSREQIEQDLNEVLERITSLTNVSFNRDTTALSTSEVIEMNSIAPWNGKPFNEKQMSIIEAHEKGHEIRSYNAPFFDTYFSTAFSFDVSKVTDNEVRMFRSSMHSDDPADASKTDEEVRVMFLEYLFSANEIAERMSQIKNYFGMSGDEAFTLEHLEYARGHYIKDTDLDNGMRIFFEAITQDTEQEFIRLINCSGI